MSGTPVDQHQIGRQIDDPDLTDAGARIEFEFDGTVEFQAGVGHLDQQEDIFGSWMRVRVSTPGSSPTPSTPGVWTRTIEAYPP